MASLPDNRFWNNTVEQSDIDYLREKGLLRDDIDVSWTIKTLESLGNPMLVVIT
ncbi:hypothetical protein PC116_g22210 [Phytophthora cactorum]|uniref:Uncharacterized protein n=1 Tax=Phytophthora cactorum TaxID=29920 RepID=A0A329RI71_9STRA|nr:hypothetical protein PC112_g19675 [Phytophthora cactorum]KAG2805212.1 hypothetical protein PC111_g17918 [Phytophthora cactorum]KAG2850060.1 hypothetical protein PC113_g17127 [Phytophthora cactorum]KAG2887543.1 hypothetical protein PC114_g18806 [Phytophthora cactorum]KAG2914820.1 hypothetical protein PC117_g18212 [Phytophthora cactorum]